MKKPETQKPFFSRLLEKQEGKHKEGDKEPKQDKRPSSDKEASVHTMKFPSDSSED